VQLEVLGSRSWSALACQRFAVARHAAQCRFTSGSKLPERHSGDKSPHSKIAIRTASAYTHLATLACSPMRVRDNLST
jgi:hypothetical protein